jgi:hypothetical protein
MYSALEPRKQNGSQSGAIDLTHDFLSTLTRVVFESELENFAKVTIHESEMSDFSQRRCRSEHSLKKMRRQAELQGGCAVPVNR